MTIAYLAAYFLNSALFKMVRDGDFDGVPTTYMARLQEDPSEDPQNRSIVLQKDSRLRSR